jgi:hypothetical protein
VALDNDWPIGMPVQRLDYASSVAQPSEDTRQMTEGVAGAATTTTTTLCLLALSKSLATLDSLLDQFAVYPTCYLRYFHSLLVVLDVSFIIHRFLIRRRDDPMR